MFKDLKVVKIIVFVVLFIFIIKAQIVEHKNIEIIFKSNALPEGKNLDFLICSNTDKFDFPIQIRKVTSSDIIIDTIIKVNKTYDYFDEIDVLTTRNPSESFVWNESLEAGIYTVNKKFPFVIKSGKPSDVTVVVPIVNKHFYTFSNGKRIFESDSSFITKVRAIRLDDWTKGLSRFFSAVEKDHEVNYITDLDLEDKKLLEHTKVLFLYGRLTFWSPQMLANLEEYIGNGGKVFIASSDLFYAKFCDDKVLEQFKTAACNGVVQGEEKIQTWVRINEASDLELNKFRYQFHSDYGGKNIKKSKVEILKPKHPIFKEVAKDKIAESLDLGIRYLGIPKEISSINTEQISIIAQTMCKRDRNEYSSIGGVFEYKKDKGNVIVIGTSDLCLEENQKREEVLKVFVNTINYLLK